MANVYITEGLLSAVNTDAVKELKTAWSSIEVLAKTGTSSIPIPPIPPDTDWGKIDIPLFGTSAIVVKPYKNIDAVKVPGDPELSAYPEPNTMSGVDEYNNQFSISGLSTNVCMIYATANAIIKRLLNDSMLMYNTDLNLTLKWLYQEERQGYYFDVNEHYPYYSMSGAEPYIIYQKVTRNAGAWLEELETNYISRFKVDYRVPLEKLISCNIIAYNTYLRKYINIKDWYIDEYRNIYLKVRTDLNNLPPSGPVYFTFYIHYFYKS